MDVIKTVRRVTSDVVAGFRDTNRLNNDRLATQLEVQAAIMGFGPYGGGLGPDSFQQFLTEL
jgi:hypothetical protein